jgi:lipopolysaccharide transport system ATP-binding protein
MSKELALKIENVSKQYRLGVIGTGTMSHDLNRWFHRVRGKEDPYAAVGVSNNRSEEGGDYVWALKNIDLDVKQGEVLGIIGKNGAGKSTLLKLLSKITSPTNGSIKINGRMATLLEVGTGFHPELTGRENVYLNGAILGMTKLEISAKIDEIVEFSGCAKYVDTPVKRYSSGMRVRLGFAVAAFLEPDILVVDEVLAVGDAEFQRKAIGKMKEVSQGGGRTVLFVSHNMVSVKNLCDRGIVLDKGEVIYRGTADDSVDYYLNKFKSNTRIPLLERMERKGNGKLRITDTYFINDEGNRVGDLISGLSYKFVLDFQKNQEVNAKEIFLGVTFLDNDETQVTLLANDEMGYSFSELNEKGQFIFEINSLSFRAGNYSYAVLISERASSSAGHTHVDVIPDAGGFEVLAGDFWGTGVINRKKGFILDAQLCVK